MPDLLLILAVAVASSALTSWSLLLLWRRSLLPELERRLDERLERARAEMEQAMERSARKGLVDALSASLPSREVLQDTTVNVARTGMELLGESLATLMGARRGRRLSDREKRQEPDGEGPGPQGS